MKLTMKNIEAARISQP